MPRDPDNNPTERIGNLLFDFQELELWSDKIIDLLITAGIDYPAPPVPTYVIQEKLRRKLTLGATKATRNNMRRVRLRQGTGHRIRAHEQYRPDMDAEIANEIMSEEEIMRDYRFNPNEPGISKSAVRAAEAKLLEGKELEEAIKHNTTPPKVGIE